MGREEALDGRQVAAVVLRCLFRGLQDERQILQPRVEDDAADRIASMKKQPMAEAAEQLLRLGEGAVEHGGALAALETQPQYRLVDTWKPIWESSHLRTISFLVGLMFVVDTLVSPSIVPVVNMVATYYQKFKN